MLLLLSLSCLLTYHKRIIIGGYALRKINTSHACSQLSDIYAELRLLPQFRSRKELFGKKNKIELLEWPVNSPDLNPIDNLWINMKNKVSEKQPSSAAELAQVVKKISKEYFKNIIDSMPRRMEAVIKSRRGNTKY